MTIADFGVASVMSVARESQLSELPTSDFPAIIRWLDGLAEVPAWRKSLALSATNQLPEGEDQPVTFAV